MEAETEMAPFNNKKNLINQGEVEKKNPHK
jgi:hypothetical protein